jgi:moderate conductance mechanosensitive channel
VVLGRYPEVWTDVGGLPNRLDGTPTGGRGLWAYLALLIATMAAATAAELGIRHLGLAKRAVIAQEFSADGRLRRVAALALLDALAVLALWLVAHLALNTIFATGGPQLEFATIVLRGLVAWRTFLLFFRLYLRPDLPAVRIAPIGDDSAYRLYRLYGFAVLIFILVRVWSGILVSPDAVSAAILANSLGVFVITAFIVLRTRGDVSSWLLGLIDASSHKTSVKAALARHWHWIALPILLALTLARANDALSNRLELPAGAILTLNIIVGLLLAETLSYFIVRTHRASLLAHSGRPHPGRLLPFVVRAVRATIWVGAAAVLVRTWAVDVLNLLDEQAWSEFRRAWTTSVLTVLFAYFAWEGVHFATERAGERPKPAPSGEGAEPEEVIVSGTRLETLAPILRIAGGIVIVLTASLTVLTSLGVNITPFIAGASVFGLAISFGSQTLVHDIVSGLFYLADDAFRVGEYIDCGKAKGTVEGFTLRSIRLRHQNGQVHTIPFGQLGQITNFSRDWSTLKFNLRMTRDTDLEKLRKVTKKVGLAMSADPELKADILEPLKLQGVADIVDNATIMRFKTTVRPVRPSYIQREAIKRLIAAFREAGIDFASATVAVQAIGSPSTDSAVAASAAAAAASATTSTP